MSAKSKDKTAVENKEPVKVLTSPYSGFRIRIDFMRIRIRIQHFFSLQIRIPDPDPGFDDLKLTKIYI
jgi:hypothetical protein